jgi:hypothetical protein
MLQLPMALIVGYTMTNIQNIRLAKIVYVVPLYVI